MKSVKEYINEASARVGSLKWGDKEWDVIEKMIKHVNDNPKHAEWYEKMAKSNDNKKYTYNVFSKSNSNPLTDKLDMYNRLKGGKKIGYWTPEGCSEFGVAMVPNILYALNSEIYFHNEDSSKDDYTDDDIKVMQSMIDKITEMTPADKMIDNRKELLELIEPIIKKYNGEIKPEDKEWDCVWIEFEKWEPWSDCLNELNKKLAKNKNVVTGDGEFNSIYIDY